MHYNLKVDESDGVFKITSKKKTPILPILLILFGFPLLALCVFKFTTSLIGMALFSTGTALIYLGIKNTLDFIKFNNNHLAIHQHKVEVGYKSNFSTFEKSKVLQFNSTGNKNSLFPFIQIIVNSNIEKSVALMVYGKNAKYLKEDGRKIADLLNAKVKSSI